jgi:sulfatase maturation enzyme AslB (radical SAM superfamily)
MSDIFCPIIHGALMIDTKSPTDIGIEHCCLRPEPYMKIDYPREHAWNNQKLIPLRQINDAGIWDKGCWQCKGNEAAGRESFRTGSLKGHGVRRDLTGPVRLDLLFDTSCNLACRSCSEINSTFWLKHLIDNGLEPFTTKIPQSRADTMIEILSTIDLSNLELVLFCGGETLLGNQYWRVAEAIANQLPTAKQQLTMSFQSNGTQPVPEKYFELIERFKLVKLHFSLDGVGERFEYLRWPASWAQVTDNIMQLRETLPSNVMFLVEETMGPLNIFYHDEITQWLKQNFATNRFGDIVNHSTHQMHGFYHLNNITQEYFELLPSDLQKIFDPNWKENPNAIRRMIQEIEKFDKIRNESWAKTFPEVYELYLRYH